MTIQAVVIANPAVATDFAVTVPAGKTWRLISMAGLFTTDANVANRNVRVAFQNAAGNIFFTAASAVVQTASQGVRYNVGHAGADYAAVLGTDQVVMTTPPITLLPTWQIRSLVQGIQAGDQWSLLVVAVEVLP